MDRRFLLAIVLVLVVLVGPQLLFKNKTKHPQSTSRNDSAPGQVQKSPSESAPHPTIGGQPSPQSRDTTTLAKEDTVWVRSSLYEYGFSTLGGRLIVARILPYKSMRVDEKTSSPEKKSPPAQIIAPSSELFAVRWLGRDTVSFESTPLTPSATSLTVKGSATLKLEGQVDSISSVELEYRFVENEYRIEVRGRIKRQDGAAGTVLVGLGPGPRNTETDTVEHARDLGVVTRDAKSHLLAFRQLKPSVPEVHPGPFKWVAVKSKYFVQALIAPDSAKASGGRINGVQLVAVPTLTKTPIAASIWSGMSVGADGAFNYLAYVGPMEHPRLRAIGHDFDDTNPYGWAWLRPVIRPIAVGARALLVWFHEQLRLAYGVALILFGILIRIVLWPLNQRAMRASMAMQAIQPLLKEVNEKYKADPQRQQQEIFKIYKEHKVNPLGGCWPVLLPWPVLIALFFVFQNSIELRGQPFLWVPDLARPDPMFIIPVVMAVSMWSLTKIGQMGLPPNPQAKMMLYFMPGMMLILFAKFAAGLNLYYTVQNLASIPQQWMIAKERIRKAPTVPPARPVKK